MKLITSLLIIAACFSCSKKETPEKKHIYKIDQTARFSTSAEISSFDPKNDEGLVTTNVLHFIYEGLTKVDENGNILDAMAENIQVSPDLKTFTFTLKESFWSNGEPVTSQDFRYAIDRQLNKENPGDLAYMLQNIKEVITPSEKVLIFELKKPMPFFLKMCATQSYFPVHKSIDDFPTPAPVTNGPFKIVFNDEGKSLVLNKNNGYWSEKLVQLQEVELLYSHDHSAYSQFESEAIQWIGAPFTSLSDDALTKFKKENFAVSTPSAGTFFIRINTEQKPFIDPSMRKAIAIGVDSQAIIDKVMDQDEQVATSFVPPVLGLSKNSYYTRNEQQARVDFDKAVFTHNATTEKLPEIQLLHIDMKRLNQIAEILQSQLQELFDIKVILNKVSEDDFYHAIKTGNYQLALDSWFADYFDPMSFLSNFQYKQSAGNHTGWSNPTYTDILQESLKEIDPEKRFKMLDRAQEILMDEMPIIPLFYYTFTSACQDELKGTYLSPMGILALDRAFMVESIET